MSPRDPDAGRGQSREPRELSEEKAAVRGSAEVNDRLPATDYVAPDMALDSADSPGDE